MSIFGRRKGDGPILRVQDSGMHWDCEDPFIFGTHHHDLYPRGNERQAPPYEEIGRRSLGMDYDRLFGYRMYCGKAVPGFPLHAHWGYETITLASEGFVDHFDTMGNQGRFGNGDMQWVTASSRYCHDEMYPLVYTDRDNPLRLTQIQLNLPLGSKNRENDVRTIWAEDLPVVEGDGFEATVLCGRFMGEKGPAPNPLSWASDPDHHVCVVRIVMEPGAEITLDPSESKTRNIYTTDGGTEVAGEAFAHDTRLKTRSDAELAIRMGDAKSEVWILEGDPIGERQVSFGPVVLGTTEEVRRANRETAGLMREEWPWEFINQKQPLGTGRFIRYAGGAEDRPGDRDSPRCGSAEQGRVELAVALLHHPLERGGRGRRVVDRVCDEIPDVAEQRGHRIQELLLAVLPKKLLWRLTSDEVGNVWL